MKLLLVGDANSFLIYNLAKELKKYRSDIVIDILSPTQLEENNGPFNHVYCTSDTGSSLGKVKYLKEISNARNIYKTLKGIQGKYNVIHILYVSSTYRLVWKSFLSKADRMILTVFGSDFYRVSNWMKSLIGGELKSADSISFSNESTLADVRDHYSLDPSRLHLCYFGLVILDELDKVTEDDLSRFREKYSIPDGKKIIACSSNASPNQNIGKIVDNLSRSEFLRESTHLTFQFHGVRNEEIEKAIETLKQSNYSHTILDGRLSDSELAAYRKVVDVMLQLQNTDQFSGAMQEHLYAGSIVITGSWLEYKILVQNKADLIRIDSFEELSEVLEKNLDRKVDQQHNKEVIGGISKWSKTISEWVKLYER